VLQYYRVDTCIKALEKENERCSCSVEWDNTGALSFFKMLRKLGGKTLFKPHTMVDKKSLLSDNFLEDNSEIKYLCRE